eukprot:2158201-Alexandrium_andersonii.AAC.1
MEVAPPAPRAAEEASANPFVCNACQGQGVRTEAYVVSARPSRQFPAVSSLRSEEWAGDPRTPCCLPRVGCRSRTPRRAGNCRQLHFARRACREVVLAPLEE